ncbi:MAG TPA: malto-oligosyltrehalose trehalohydrolase [Dongiaceae bacterium]|jgi:malto-oligosyltrehalose trehalohydrolase
MATRHAVPLSHGAAPIDDGRTRFQFWAPDRNSVALEIEGRAPQPMIKEEEGWFRLEAHCGPGTRYRYRLSPDLAVPDPASRAQQEDVAGYSIVVDPASYSWRNADWRGRPWHETILYEAHIGLAGGYRAFAERLPGLADLGITAVELMPVAEFPGSRNWGYDGVLPFAPEASYGSPDDLKALIDRAHDLGLMMIQDVVYNHFGPEGNYLNSYASAFFRPDIHTPWGSALDFKHPVVRRFFIENALYWLEEFQFDGLRLDAVHAIPERNWLIELSHSVKDWFRGRREIHLVLENDNNDAGLLDEAFSAQWNDDAHHAAHVLITGETEGYYSDYAKAPAYMLARCLAEGFAFQGDPSEYREGARRGASSGHLPPTRFVFFLQNHDQVGNRAFGDRLAAIADRDVLRVGVAVLLLAPQIPLLFMGEERGAREPFLFFTNYSGDLAKAVRDGRRREFGKFPAFATDEAQSGIPDPNRESTFASSRFAEDAGDWAEDWQSFYRELLKLRRSVIVPRLVGARSEGAEVLNAAALLARWVLGDGAKLTLAMNFGAEGVAFQQPQGRKLFACGENAAAQQGILPRHSFVALLDEPQ